VNAEAGLRRGILGLVVVGSLGVMLELALGEHWQSPVQLLPFVLGSLAAGAAVARLVGVPRSLWPSRVVFGVAVAGAAFGVWEHLEHNWAFAAEIDAAATTGELLKEAVMGANPALAPGALVLLGLFGALATWRE
jgi:hypothetical protein